MPFTLAHPAAVIPLHRRFHRHLSLVGLVIGSIIPDAAYFLPANRWISDPFDPGTIYLWALPLGVLCSAIVQWRFGHDAARVGAGRVADAGTAAGLWALALSVVIGITSHFVWDSMTHGSGWCVQHFPPLQAPVLRMRSGVIYSYFVFKHFSSVVGVLLLAYWFYPRILCAVGQRPIVVYPVIFLVSLCSAMLLAVVTMHFGYVAISNIVRVAMVCGMALVGAWYALLTLRPLKRS